MNAGILDVPVLPAWSPERARRSSPGCYAPRAYRTRAARAATSVVEFRSQAGIGDSTIGAALLSRISRAPSTKNTTSCVWAGGRVRATTKTSPPTPDLGRKAPPGSEAR